MRKVAVVILNWNGKHFLEKFLPLVIKYSIENAEVIVADNASSDDSVAFLTERFPQVRLILNDKNYGFAQGYNKALKHVQADYYVLLNSDIEVTPHWIQPVIDLMEQDENIGVCQPKLLSYYKQDEFEYAGAAGGFIDYLGYPFCRGRIFIHLEKDKGQYQDACEIFWATGAALFVRSALYEKLGGLDDDFFAHMEEIDFCWRVKNWGYKVLYCPHSKVYHVGGGTLPKSSSMKTYLNFRNDLVLLYKNLPSNKIAIVFFIRFFLDSVASIKFLLEGSIKETFAVTKAYLYFICNFNKIRKKRYILPHKRTSQIYKRSIVWDYYFRKKRVFSNLNPEDFTS